MNAIKEEKIASQLEPSETEKEKKKEKGKVKVKLCNWRLSGFGCKRAERECEQGRGKICACHLGVKGS